MSNIPMKNVIVLGTNGMLGRYVTKHLSQSNLNVVGLTRADFDPNIKPVSAILNYYSPDVIINCIGVINKDVERTRIVETINVNSIFPHQLAASCKFNNIRLIHITTDCVFSGKLGLYSEQNSHDPLDVYGKTKSLGEPTTSMNIRTSIIGEELGIGKSLISWVKSNRNNEVYGYENHIWNGVTCLELAKFIEKVIKEEKYWEGTRHVFSPDKVSKHQLISMIGGVFNIPMKIIPTSTITSVDRSLTTIYDKEIQKPLYQQLLELTGYIEK